MITNRIKLILKKDPILLILPVISKSSTQGHLSCAAEPQTRTEETYLKGKPAFSGISKTAENKQQFIEKDNSSGNH